MTGMSGPATTARFDAAFLAWNTVAGYPTYEEAQASVNKLAEQGFPVQHLDIIGSDVRIVERVAGKLTRGRAALAGASQGVWMGLFAGLLLSIFAGGAAVSATILVAMLIGAAIGAGLGFATQSALRGKRGFASTRTFVAGRYDLVARDGFAEQAREAMQRSQPYTL